MPIPALPMPTPSAAEVHPSAASAAATAVYQISEQLSCTLAVADSVSAEDAIPPLTVTNTSDI